MNLRNLFFALLTGLTMSAQQQNSGKEVLFTIDKNPYYTDEFIRVYNKNLDLVKDESQKNLDQYLELFIGYKLKVNKAFKLGLQNGTQYQNELKSYRTQLSKNYLMDSKVTQELLDEGYERLKKEVNASHILLMVDENAAPADTLAAYNKIMAIRDRIVKNGEDFGTVAMAASQDPSAKENKGNLGYFTAFRMVYAFENGAYNTALGQVSMPVRSRFGYHIIKVNDIRNNRGEVAVSHIMILKPKEGEDPTKAKTTIDEIYQKLQQGEQFEELAKQFSEDKSSSTKGGVLNKFASGQLSSEEFENQSFALTKENPLSKPFETAYGWHIVKLNDKFPLRTKDEMKMELENKIARDDRSKKISDALAVKLRKKYPVKPESKLYKEIAKSVDDSFYKGEWKMPADLKKFDTKLFVIGSKEIKGGTFMDYLYSQQKSAVGIKPVSKLVDYYFSRFADEQRAVFNNENLENEYPEFAAVMSEYRDGLLLFDLMEKEIWQKAKTDSIGLKDFYEKNKQKYLWKTRFDAEIYSSTKPDVMKKVLALLKKGNDAKTIKEKFNSEKELNVMMYDGIYEEGADALPKNIKAGETYTEISQKGEYYYIAKIRKVIPAGVKSLEECKGRVTNEYQQFLEQNWIDTLKKEFQININKDVFERVKQQIKK
ncbi:peptidylprolyl isomerase [Flavobacterium stagni]|uniref:Peptidylprolyl isomerase n=1 Tax=Flavobacterium stagni TaxID=2506421 RepID=A0A4Q1K826_9FLAO|nr:peptidylprolyl isomerase [Flavobacterium stagni]RXR22446.1 peptidylprolyl isomerase [Flavobacterium stagni]